jgi:hypothetical protein
VPKDTQVFYAVNALTDMGWIPKDPALNAPNNTLAGCSQLAHSWALLLH